MRLALLLFFGALVTAALAILTFSPHTYTAQDRVHVSAPAGRGFPAGTDELGRDRAVRLALALLLGLAGACAASTLASTLSLLLGSAAALCPRWAASLSLNAGDLFLTLPWIFLLILVRAALPLSLPPLRSGLVTFLLLAFLGVPIFIRLNYRRAKTLFMADWVLHARATGLRSGQIARQMLPHFRPVFRTQFLLYVPVCIIAEANLGTLGLGIAQPVPSWGNMLGDLQSAALFGTSRLMYLPLVLLVLVLAGLELSTSGARRDA